MQVVIREKQPEIKLLVSHSEEEYRIQEFLIDTGFSGTCVFIFESEKLLTQLEFFSIQDLPRKDWITLADGRRRRTSKAKIIMVIEKVEEVVEVLLLESDKEDIPIIGVDFLITHKRCLTLDFRKNIFELT
jgi:predicted aspartyl protease